MVARVDIRQMQVRDGDLVLPFTADCGAGTAVLDPFGQPLRLRTLRWGEKCRLARYADADAAFLETQFLAICSNGEPPDTTRRPALVALALWLQGSATPALTLDPLRLAQVTLGLCKTLGLTPLELGDMAAPEVEALWHAHGTTEVVSASPGAEVVADGVTRIVIEPDLVSTAPEDERFASEVTRPSDQPADASVSQSLSPQAPRPAQQAQTEPTAAGAPATSAASAHETADDEPPSVVTRTAGPAFPRRLHRRSGTRGPVPRFRIGTGPARGNEVAPPAADLVAAAEAPGEQPSSISARPTPPATPETRPMAPTAKASVRAAPSVAVTPPAPSASASTESAPTALGSQLDTLIGIVSRAASLPRAESTDPDSAIESFGDRLAEAVDELGLTGGV